MASAVQRRAPQSSLGRRTAYRVRHHIGPALLGVLIGVGTMYGLDRRPPLTLGQPEVPEGTVEPGHIVVVTWPQEWHRLCPGTVSRELTTAHGEVKKFHPFDIQPPRAVGEVSQTSTIYIPNNTHDGPATMQSTISFRCNFLNDFWPIVVKAPPVIIQVASR